VTLSGGPEASSGAWVQTCSIFWQKKSAL
jgi:hypothetical protein